MLKLLNNLVVILKVSKNYRPRRSDEYFGWAVIPSMKNYNGVILQDTHKIKDEAISKSKAPLI